MEGTCESPGLRAPGLLRAKGEKKSAGAAAERIVDEAFLRVALLDQGELAGICPGVGAVTEVRITFLPIVEAALNPRELDRAFGKMRHAWDSLAEEGRHFFLTFDTALHLVTGPSTIQRIIRFFWEVKDITIQYQLCSVVLSDNRMVGAVISIVRGLYTPQKPVLVRACSCVAHEEVRALMGHGR